MRLLSHAIVPVIAGTLASAAMSAFYVRGGPGWLLGFIFLVPWLCTLEASATLTGTLLRAWAMSIAFTAAAFAWFGTAIGLYGQLGGAAGLALLLLAAPLFQPQFLIFALVRHVAMRRHGAVLGAMAGAAAWVAAEWLLPKLLGDTIGHGLYPSRLLRQGADVGGAAGLTLLLLLANECAAAALSRRHHGLPALAKPLVVGALVPLALAGYGWTVLSGEPVAGGPTLRVGLIQANMVAYERQRQEKGAYGVVRDVLDTHFAMSYDAVERQKADAVMWSETAYPTTFGQPKSIAGADFDRAILGIVDAAGVPFIFGTYDRDHAGEYNAAAFVQPGSGLTGFYRKTHLFPLTEYVPAWLDSPLLRRSLPWTGNWRAGNGARVFPLRLKDGREIAVLPLICLDDVDSALAIDGARLGAQAILTMSNDSWFSADSPGARMHHSVAAFRSIETRLPQFRVTTNGFSAVIDATGSVLAGAHMDERTLVVGDVPVGSPAPTLMVKWGNWVGLAASMFLATLAAWSALRWWQPAVGHRDTPALVAFPLTVSVLPPVARVTAGLLRAAASAGLFAMCVALLFNESLRTNTLAQMRMFATFILAPLAASWCVLFLYLAKASIAGGRLVLARGKALEEIALTDIAAVQLWRVLLPCPGLSVRFKTGQRWRYGLALRNPQLLAAALAAAGCRTAQEQTTSRMVFDAYLQARLAIGRSRLDHPIVKYALLSLALAVPAFHLQQQIAYGGPFGEYYAYGLKAYLGAFALWWAAWAIGVTLSDALLRAAVAAGTLMAALVRPTQAVAIRRSLHSVRHVALFFGLPAWLLLTIYAR